MPLQGSGKFMTSEGVALGYDGSGRWPAQIKDTTFNALGTHKQIADMLEALSYPPAHVESV